MYTLDLKAKQGLSFKGDFFDSHEMIASLTSTKSVGNSQSKFFQLGLRMKVECCLREY